MLELGSGHSSKLLSTECNLYTIEHNKEWLHKYPDVNYFHVPLMGLEYDRVVFSQIITGLDVKAMIIDGPPGYGNKQGSREMILDQKELISKCNVVLIDDTHRKSELKIAKELSKQFTNHKIIQDGIKEAWLLWK